MSRCLVSVPLFTLMITLAAAAQQQTIPVQQLQVYVDGFHNYQHQSSLPAEKQHQMRVTHYCQALRSDFIQCAVYNGNSKDAHLIGIEYIVADEVYKGLPAAEKKYWHPHDGEVDTGMLDLPGLPEARKQAMLQTIRTTHGKTWHVWNHGDHLPTGEPALMWAIDPQKMNAETRKQMEQRKKDPAF
jgi:Protein of unknown function (DUF1264)